MIPVAPPVVSADLAESARANPGLTQARRLAEWVGSGRQLTARGVPRPAEAVEACQLLGIEPPGSRLRSALDVHELMVAWTVAIDAGFVIAEGSQAWSVPEAMATDPKTAMDAWVKAAAADLGLPGEPCAGCLTVLYELYVAGDPLDAVDLAGVISATGQTPGPMAQPCPDCGGIHLPDNSPGLLGFGGPHGIDLFGADPAEHLEEALGSLLYFEAAEMLTDTAVRLTPLGALLARAVFEDSVPAPDADAGALLAVISDMPPSVAISMAQPWFDARSADAAVRELLGFAESAAGSGRVISMALARARGPEAIAVWREHAGRPGFGAYARTWLAEQGEDVPEQPADEAWLQVDLLTMALEAMSDTLPPMLQSTTIGQQLGALPGMREMLIESGHPAAARLLDMLPTTTITIMPPPPRGLAQLGDPDMWETPGGDFDPDDVYELKISLRQVVRPPVWRRVQVPAGIRLDDLSKVIQISMGWANMHLHVFESGGVRYGHADEQLEFIEEAGVQLGELMVDPGDRLLYTYDFGDGWEHDVVLNKVPPAAPGNIPLPFCTGGKGACPPEDCGGPYGYRDLKVALTDPQHPDHASCLDWLAQFSDVPFDPKAFSIDTVNAQLTQLTLSP